MGHELRSPLSAILGFAQIMGDDAAAALPAAVQAGMIRQVEASGLSLLGMINDLVELSKLEAGRPGGTPELVDLARLITEVAAQMLPQASAVGVALSTKLPRTEVTLRTDRLRARHLLSNLVAHAIRYNRRDGSVCMALEVDPRGHAHVQVSDTGAGLAPEMIAALFDPFAQTTLDGSSLQGAGIGMYVSRRLAQALGGTLELQCDPGVGCVSSLMLPREASASVHENSDMPGHGHCIEMRHTLA